MLCHGWLGVGCLEGVWVGIGVGGWVGGVGVCGGGLASWLIKDVLWAHLSDAQCRECHALCAMGGWVLAGWVGGVGTRVVVGWVEWVCGGREGGG